MRSLNDHGELESIALLSVEVPRSAQEASERQAAERSDLIWSLKRIGVTQLIAPPEQLSALEMTRRSLSPPPPDPKHDPHTLLGLLREFERVRSQRDPIGEIGWPQAISLISPPMKPLTLGACRAQPIQLCFHDELLGVPRALLIHYGETLAELSGYHANISSISVPIGGEASAIVVLRLSGGLSARIARHALPHERSQGSTHLRLDQSLAGGPTSHQDELICVAHLSASGILIDGPWWPNLLSSTS